MAVIKKDKSKETTIVNQLVIKPANRSTSDVGKWRNALQSADKGKTKNLFDLFDDLLIDGVLSGSIEKRINAVKLAALTFQDANGQEVEEITNIIDSPGFENLLDVILQQKFWGRSGGEFNFSVDEGFEFTPIPFKHINVENKIIAINETDETGIDYTADDFLLVLGAPRQFGLLLKAAPFAIWKRGGFGDWAEWLEVFGMPQRIGKYNSNDPESRILLEQAFEAAGSAPWLVVPKESEIEQKTDGANSSSNTSYNDFRKACNEEMLITILGQTMTTLDGSSRSQSETHKDVEDSLHQSDCRFVQRVLNFVIKPILEKRGIPVTNGKFIYPEDNESITVDDVVKLADIIDIPASYLYEKYGIPVPDEGEEIARVNTAAPVVIDENIENADKNAFKRLLNFFVSAPQAGASKSTTRIKLNDPDFTDRIIQHTVDNGAAFNVELFDWVSTNLLTALDAKAVKLADLGFEYSHQNDAFRTAQELNVFHFSASKTLAEAQTLNELYRKSSNFESFHHAAREKVDVFNKTWQRTEWQSATLISESTANFNRLSRKTKLYPYWKYVAVMDEKTRPEHAGLNGLILPANDPRWSQIWPPNGWKCRCYVVPLMAHEVDKFDINVAREEIDAFLKSPEWKAAKAQGFGVNRALTPMVFAENQMYIKKFPGMAKRLLKHVNYKTHGLKSMEQNRKLSSETINRFKGNLNEFSSTLTHEQGQSFLIDYNGRKLALDLTKWQKAHKSKEAARTPYLNALKETVKSPNEVWINAADSKTFNQYVFVKYYTNETIIAIAEIKGNKYTVKTWFPVKENKQIALKFRSGLLIKKMVQ